ncbi:MAG: monovalent cation:proton antiporter-2 (CPA2) family protein [Microscillaceae bacterium]
MASPLLENALIFMGAALVAVPVAKKLGVGSVLGYIFGGAFIGPYALGLIGQEGEDIMHTAEFGVVMMLFLIGLELNPASFWRMRRFILGLGLLQMLLTALLVGFLLAVGFSYSGRVALVLALSFGMSSTAIVLQTLKEKGLDKTQAGRFSFAVLLFQDIAVIPILALLPLLALSPPVAPPKAEGHLSIFAQFGADYPSLAIFLAVLLIVLVGRFLINPFLRLIARVHMRELFTASALFLVMGVAWLMESVGISAALGTFMAGVLLANSEFRHELESDIEPFKGVLLGVFFTAVGSTINFALILAQPGRVLAMVALVMLAKSLVLLGLGRLFGLKTDQNLLFAILLSQIGEFAFVLLASAQQLAIFDPATLDFFMAVVALSMVVSPLLLFVNERLIDPFFGVKAIPVAPQVPEIEEENNLIIVGFGHFGSTLGRFLRANGVSATILDNDSDRVALLRKMDFKVFYGDATRLDLLLAAGAARAKMLVSAIDDPEKNLALAETLQKHFPHLKIFIRAKNRYDAYELMDKGLQRIYRESVHASVLLGVDVLAELGHRRYTAQRKASEFIKYDEAALQKLAAERHQTESYIQMVKEEIAQQEKLLQEDTKFFDQHPDNAWDAPGIYK